MREKNGKIIKMPVQHKLEEHLDAYTNKVGGTEAFPFETRLACDRSQAQQTKRRPLFLSTRGRTGILTNRRMTRQDAWRMVRRRAKHAGIKGDIANHSSRGTGITNYWENGGNLAEAQRMAGHADPRTTRLYDRRDERITRSEVERITILG